MKQTIAFWLTCVAVLTCTRVAEAVVPPYRQGFETFTNCPTQGGGCPAPCLLSSGWTNAAGDNIDWMVRQGPTPSMNTGPDVDHTLGTAAGRYIYVESSCMGIGFPFATANLITPPLELMGTTAPRAQFWYHMFGTTMGTLHIDVSTDGGMTFTPDLIAPITANANQWQLSPVIDLTPYIGQTILLRFRGITGTSFESDMAIDDFVLGELNDVGATAVLAPLDGVCGTSMSDVTIRIGNFGIAPQSNVPLSVNVTGAVNAMLTAMVAGPIPSGGNGTATVQIDAFSAGAITVLASTTLMGDANTANNAVSAMRTMAPTEVLVNTVTPVCPGDSAMLAVTMPEVGVTYGWYDAATLGTQLGTGNMFTTAAVSLPTDFWVQRESATPDNIGPMDNMFGTGAAINNMALGMRFDVSQPVIIDHVYVYPNGPGNVVVNLLDSMNNVLQTATVVVNSVGTKTQIPLGLPVQPGTGYQLIPTGTNTGGLFRNDSGAGYPYAGTGLTITDTTNNLGTSAGYYYYFYDWQVSPQVCNGERTPVSVAIDPNCSTDVGVTLTDSPDPVAPGATVQLTATVTNMGSIPASAVSVTTTLPPELTNAVTTGCAEDPAGVPTCTLGDVIVFGNASFTIDVDVAPTATGTVQSSVTLSTTTNDTDPTNDTATASTTIDGGAGGAGGAGPGPSTGAGPSGAGVGGGAGAPVGDLIVEDSCGCTVPGAERRISAWGLLALAGAAGAVRLVRRKRRI